MRTEGILFYFNLKMKYPLSLCSFSPYANMYEEMIFFPVYFAYKSSTSVIILEETSSVSLFSFFKEETKNMFRLITNTNIERIHQQIIDTIISLKYTLQTDFYGGYIKANINNINNQNNCVLGEPICPLSFLILKLKCGIFCFSCQYQ